MQVRKIAIVMAMLVGVCGAALALAPEAPPELVFLPPMEKVTFLGIAMRPLGREEGKKLNLPIGVGVKVDFVEKGSPAATLSADFVRRVSEKLRMNGRTVADLVVKAGDVLTKLDDQIVVNPEQMTALVRMHKPGDKVKLTFVRDGGEQQVEAVLAQKEVPVQPERHDDDGPGFGDIEFDVIKNVLKFKKDNRWVEVTRDKAGRERAVVKRIGGGVEFDGAMPKSKEELEALPTSVRNVLKGLKGFGMDAGIEQALAEDRLNAARRAREMVQNMVALARADARGAGLTLVTTDGLTVKKLQQPWVIVKDAKGKVLHDGLVTPDELAPFIAAGDGPMPKNVRLACDAALGISVRVPLDNAAIQPTVSFKMPDGLTVEKTDKFVYTISKKDPAAIFDGDDGVLFDGPMPPDAEKAKLPEAVRRALDTAQNIQVLGDMVPGTQLRMFRPGGEGAPFRMELHAPGGGAHGLPAPPPMPDPEQE